ncbi:MAG: lipoprotein [candidate division NC10 bacterium]|nr:lipoprotein [candidate division NC10 bacterium]
MKRIVSILIALALIVLAGCATFRGMAQDFENLGRGIKKTASE